MRLVILESPYAGTDDPQKAEEYTHMCIRDSLERGEAPIASHVTYTKALDDTKPIERALGIAAGHSWMGRADAVVVYNDYGVTDGMRAGLAVAEELNLPVDWRVILD